MKFNETDLAWEKSDGLLPAIVQHATTNSVLMLGYMNREALKQTLHTKKITFFSRSKNRLWVKGETSGNYLELKNISADCDRDTILISAQPRGAVCHNGTLSCFAGQNNSDWEFIQELEQIIAQREKFRPANSYVTALFNSGISRIAQKVGEESVELILAAMDADRKHICEEAADLFFHFLVLLKAKNLNLSAVIEILSLRCQSSRLLND